MQIVKPFQNYSSYLYSMDIITYREYITSLPNVIEWEFPGADSVIYKIGGRWFSAVSFARGNIIAVKCDPDRAIMLRDLYPQISPAWHFNKKHWNDIALDPPLPDDFVESEIRHSYLLTILKNVSPKPLRLSLLLEAERAGIVDNAIR
jgi:predicted DNA-binding protein (MmcQ/YjbR family)